MHTEWMFCFLDYINSNYYSIKLGNEVEPK